MSSNAMCLSLPLFPCGLNSHCGCYREVEVQSALYCSVSQLDDVRWRRRALVMVATSFARRLLPSGLEATSVRIHEVDEKKRVSSGSNGAIRIASGARENADHMSAPAQNDCPFQVNGRDIAKNWSLFGFMRICESYIFAAQICSTFAGVAQ